MFSIAEFLDRAKARANIESDYRLAKVIGKNHQVISSYRVGKSLPEESVIEQLCALSGDDPGVIAAQIQAERSRSPEAKTMWRMIAARLAGGATTAILSVLFAIGFIAASPYDARASAVHYQKVSARYFLYIVSTGVFVRWTRLRHRFNGLPCFFRLCLAACW